MKKIIEINKKIINIFYDDLADFIKLPVVILNTYDEDGQEIWSKTKELNNRHFILITITKINWNKEMSPWYMNRFFKEEEDYSGDADTYINELTNIIIPRIENILKDMNLEIESYTIAGYSLAGLFSIYCLYKTRLFKNAISCSGSLWYPNFSDYIKNNDMKIIPSKIYFSLGNKESKTRNKLMSTVEERTKCLKEYYEKLNIQTIYEENEGNHFQDVPLRIAKGISWIL